MKPARNPVLPDHIRAGLSILFVGINPGLRSAQAGHHFAGPSNRFWPLLYESGLVSEPIRHDQDWRLPEWGLGMTNIIHRASRGIDTLSVEDYRAGVAALTRKVRRYRPQIVALLGVTLYRILFTEKPSSASRLALGLTSNRLAGVPIFLLPNPSGRNAHYSYREMLSAYCALRAHKHTMEIGRGQ